jgi:hypothetical protein
MAQPAHIPDFDEMARAEQDAVRRSGQEIAESASLMAEALPAPQYDREVMERASSQTAQHISALEPPPISAIPSHLMDSDGTVL